MTINTKSQFLCENIQFNLKTLYLDESTCPVRVVITQKWTAPGRGYPHLYTAAKIANRKRLKNVIVI